MSPMDSLRLFVLCFWLLACDVNCDNAQRGYVLRVPSGHSPVGVYIDRNEERQSEAPIFPTAGKKTSSVDRGHSGAVYLAQEDHTTDSKPSETQSQAPKSKGNRFKSGLNTGSVAGGRSTVVYNSSGKKAAALPDGKRSHQARPGSVFSTGSFQFKPLTSRTRAKLKGAFSPDWVDKGPEGFGPNTGLIYSHRGTASLNIHASKSSLRSESKANPSRPKKRPLHPWKLHLSRRPDGSGYRSAFNFPKSLNHSRSNSSPKVPKPDDKTTGSILKGHAPDGNSAGQVKDQPYPAWSPRAYKSDVMSEAKGYTHVWRLKLGFDKTRPQVGSAAGRKFSEAGFPSMYKNEGSDSTKLGLCLGVPPRDRAQIMVQGKFKPFQRLPANNKLSVHTNSSDGETAPAGASAGTTLPPGSNTTGNTSTAIPSVSTELSTSSSSPVQTEGQDPEPLPQTSNLEGQSDSSAEAGPSMNQNGTFTASPPQLQAAVTDTSSPLGTDQSGV